MPLLTASFAMDPMASSSLLLLVLQPCELLTQIKTLGMWENLNWRLSFFWQREVKLSSPQLDFLLSSTHSQCYLQIFLSLTRTISLTKFSQVF